MKRVLLLVCMLVVLCNRVAGQIQKLSGVYVGAELYTTPFEGMQINNIVLYFRNDGTFNDDLKRSDWKTNVSGTYSIRNNMVQITFKGQREPERYRIGAKGALESTAGVRHTLHKVKRVSAVPAGGYERRSASSSGGVGTGTPNVFVSSTGHLYFDGKGSFSLNRSSMVGIGGSTAGGTIGGKFENKDKSSSGRYRLGDGEIVLTFNDGRVSRHSFFYSPPDEEDLILLDGEFYFREEEQSSSVRAEAPEGRHDREVPAEDRRLPDAAQLLAKLRSNYGGQNIDKLNTVRETATMSGNLRAVVLTDIVNSKVRAEVWQKDKLLLVRQLEGEDGWQWIKGSKGPLTAEEKKEMKNGLYQGILGLHKRLNAYFLRGTVSKSNSDYMLTFSVNGSKLIYLLGEDYTLKANASSGGTTPSFLAYKSFIKKDGISYPLVTESSDGKTTLTLTTRSTEFNPTFTASSWEVPK